MSRCLSTILKVVTNLTPESEVDIHLQLASIKSTVEFLDLPEQRQLHWKRISDAFDPVTNPPEQDWQLAVCAVLNDEPLETIKQLVAEHKRNLQDS